jgi:hypothetical protein
LETPLFGKISGDTSVPRETEVEKCFEDGIRERGLLEVGLDACAVLVDVCEVVEFAKKRD